MKSDFSVLYLLDVLLGTLLCVAGDTCELHYVALAQRRQKEMRANVAPVRTRW